LLVTRRELDLEAPEHDEVLRTTHSLLSHGNIPILNENDGVTHAELSHQAFGQNDEIAAIFAAQIAQSSLFGGNVKLLLLSDIDGVYRNQDDPSTLIKKISNVDEYNDIAGDSNSANAKGGMKTKFLAAKIAKKAGVEMWIANGRTENAIQRAIDLEIGTYFPV